MATYTIELTDAEDKCLRYETSRKNANTQEWVTGYIKGVCDRGSKNIIDLELKKAMDSGGSLSGTRDEIILAANLG
tara:strand:+ start:3133 stop:3360 length:228 start_codon:yes stop_codon:yes gene_type:complete